MATFPNGIQVNIPRGMPRNNGLLSVFRPTTPSDNRWMLGGLNWEDYLCGAVSETFVDNVCEAVTGTDIEVDRGGISFCLSDPFGVRAGVECSVGGRDSGEWFEIARQRLLQTEEKAVEAAFWTGITSNGTINPSLATGNEECDLDVVDLSGGTVGTPVDGISVLEEALGQNVTGMGYIHVPIRLMAYLANLNVVFADDGGLYSPSGHRYVVGAGYPGSGPDNVEAGAGTTWMFATGPVGVWASDMYMVPDTIGEAVNRQINDVTVAAERYYTLGFACDVYAVNVDLTIV